jgi:hypothetical protein
MSGAALRVLVAVVTTRFVLFGSCDDWSDDVRPGRSALRARIASARAFTNAMLAYS